jgi:hypothetical protein
MAPPRAGLSLIVLGRRVPRVNSEQLRLSPRYASSYLTLRQSRSRKTLSRQAPLPSMLMAMPLLASTPVKAEPVNCKP